MENPDLHLCNLVARGMTVKEARKFLADASKAAARPSVPSSATGEAAPPKAAGPTGEAALDGTAAPAGEKPTWMP